MMIIRDNIFLKYPKYWFWQYSDIFDANDDKRWGWNIREISQILILTILSIYLTLMMIRGGEVRLKDWRQQERDRRTATALTANTQKDKTLIYQVSKVQEKHLEQNFANNLLLYWLCYPQCIFVLFCNWVFVYVYLYIWVFVYIHIWVNWCKCSATWTVFCGCVAHKARGRDILSPFPPSQFILAFDAFTRNHKALCRSQSQCSHTLQTFKEKLVLRFVLVVSCQKSRATTKHIICWPFLWILLQRLRKIFFVGKYIG